MYISSAHNKMGSPRPDIGIAQISHLFSFFQLISGTENTEVQLLINYAHSCALKKGMSLFPSEKVISSGHWLRNEKFNLSMLRDSGLFI